MLAEPHVTHSGMAAKKAMTRSLCWWPGIDQDIRNTVCGCHRHQQAQLMPPAVEPLLWPAASSPWSRVHMDYAGPIDGQVIFVVVEDRLRQFLSRIPYQRRL